jgi:hypothetical protein
MIEMEPRAGGVPFYRLIAAPANNIKDMPEVGDTNVVEFVEADSGVVVIPPPPEYDPASVAFPSKAERILTPEAEAERDDFEAKYGMLGNCSCHIFPPCGSCTHPGNPRNQEEDETAWMAAGDSEGGETDAPAPMIVAMTSSGGPTDPLDDIRHVLSLPDDLPADKVAEAVRLRVAGLTRSVQDLQNQLAAISIALQQSGIDLENQSPVESIQALNGAIKLLKDELDRESQPVLVPIKNVTDESLADKALHDLRATIAGTGATLTIREQSDMVGVIYHRNRLAVARPGRELIEVVEAIRTLNQHTPRQEAA